MRLLDHLAMARPERIVGVSYIGPGAYFITTCTIARVNAFENIDFGRFAAESLIADARDFGFAVPAYCLMPDHAHLVLLATRDDASLTRFIARWKQATGFGWSRLGNGPLWQEGYWERILRDEESILSVARYAVENPLRAHLVTDPRQYPLLGSSEYTIDQILEAVQMNWGRCWRRR